MSRRPTTLRAARLSRTVASPLLTAAKGTGRVSPYAALTDRRRVQTWHVVLSVIALCTLVASNASANCGSLAAGILKRATTHKTSQPLSNDWSNSLAFVTVADEESQAGRITGLLQVDVSGDFEAQSFETLYADVKGKRITVD